MVLAYLEPQKADAAITVLIDLVEHELETIHEWTGCDAAIARKTENIAAFGVILKSFERERATQAAALAAEKLEKWKKDEALIRNFIGTIKHLLDALKNGSNNIGIDIIRQLCHSKKPDGWSSLNEYEIHTLMTDANGWETDEMDDAALKAGKRRRE
jgi:hypothetical protein